MNTYPFEIHLTVEGFGAPLAWFEDSCEKLGLKPIVLDLFTKEGIESQATTSSVFHADSVQSARAEMGRLSNAMRKEGWFVTREKLETVPHHPITETFDNTKYFETHMTFLADDEERNKIEHYCTLYGVRISQNNLRNTQNDLQKFMGTIRDYDTRDNHVKRLKTILNYLSNNDINPVQMVTEYAVHDTNANLDKNWINDHV